MSDPDDIPVPRPTETYGALYWLRYARELLGPRRTTPSTRVSLRELARRTEEPE